MASCRALVGPLPASDNHLTPYIRTSMLRVDSYTAAVYDDGGKTTPRIEELKGGTKNPLYVRTGCVHETWEIEGVSYGDPD